MPATVTSRDPASRARLSQFLRGRRARIAPAPSEIAPTRARPAAGLNRSQTARLCGISTTWYLLVETGRASGVSARTVAAIAHALRLSEAETRELHELIEAVYGRRFRR